LCEGAEIPAKEHTTHGLSGGLEEPDWPPLTLDEADAVLRRYPAAGGAVRLLSVSPRPFSAASVVAGRGGRGQGGRVVLKRHHVSVRDRGGLMEEHRLMAFLAAADWGGGERLVSPPLADLDGETAVPMGEWVYEAHAVAPGVDVYEDALSWTPFFTTGHARAAGRAMARMHLAARGYDAPARARQQLVSSFTIFAGSGLVGSEFDCADKNLGDDPVARMAAYLEARPGLKAYAEKRDWRASMERLLLPFHGELRPWLRFLEPLWTHNDFHASNLMWSGDSADAEVTAIIDLGLADRTNAVHDLATAIERNGVEWLRMGEAGAGLVRLEQIAALLAGYEEVRPLSYEERSAVAAMLPLVHCEFALSETDYFLSVLHSDERAYLGYEGYFLGHAAWFRGEQGQALLDWLKRWAEDRTLRGPR
jgi:Ser/Thr protein kinase RdoA (MazF antagonist)